MTNQSNKSKCHFPYPTMNKIAFANAMREHERYRLCRTLPSLSFREQNSNTCECDGDCVRLFSSWGKRYERPKPPCPILITNVPDLQESCAVKVATSLIWNWVNLRGSRNTIGCRLWALLDQHCKLSCKLPIPKSIVYKIFTYVNKMYNQIDDWVSYHESVFLQDYNHFQLDIHIPYFIWYPNGKIDYEKTALNLLSSPRLGEKEKFILLCTYCLKDEFAKFQASSSMFAHKNSIRNWVDFSQHPLIFYWNCYFRNELQKIPVEGTMTIDRFMFQHPRVDNWWAKEYFFNRMTSEEKVQGAVCLIDKCLTSFEERYQELVLLKLNPPERIEVYRQRSEEIISNYSRTGKYSEEILSTWFNIRDLIDAERFVSIFDKLLKSKYLKSILKDVWASACDDFKHHLLNDRQIIGRIFQLQMENLENNDDEFLFTLLSDCDVHVKKIITENQFFKSYCEILLQERKFLMFERLLKECLGKGHELEEFRQYFIVNSVTVQNEYLAFYLKGQIKFLNDFLNQLLPSRPDLVQEYKKNLLLSSYSIEELSHRFGSESTSNVLNLITTDGLPTDDSKAEFRKRFIFAPNSISILQSWLVINRFPDVKQYVDSYLASNDDKKVLKKRLVTNFDDKLAIIFSKHKIETIRQMLYWCLEDGESLPRYKSTLNVDTIFDRLLQDAVILHKPFHMLVQDDAFFLRKPLCLSSDYVFNLNPEVGPLEEFLNWYFGSESKVKQYKLQRIEAFRRISVIDILVEKGLEIHLENVMRWFFDEDREKIEKFKRKHLELIFVYLPGWWYLLK